jgi:aminopeptidase N
MKRLLFLLIPLVFVTCSSSASAQDSIKKLPAAYRERKHPIDVKHIALDLHFDWKKKQAIGTAAITFTILETTNRLALDAAMLSIGSVQLDNGKALAFEYDGGDQFDGLALTLDKKYKPGEQLTIVIDYRTNYVNEADPNNIAGSLDKGLRFFEPTSSTPNKRRQIFSSGEPDANRYWFPCIESIADLHTTEIRATVEKPLMAIANGNLVSTKENGNDTRTFHYKTDTAYPNYLTVLAIGEYTDVQQRYKKIALHTFGYPHEKEAVEATVERLPEMVQFFSAMTGVDYPYPQFTQAVVQDYPFPAGTGQHSAVLQSDNMIDDFKTHADFLYLWDGVESQGLASQWFGNWVMPKNWAHIWLNQSFARYADGEFTNHKNGHAEFLMYYHNFDMGVVLGDWLSGLRHPIVTQNFDNLAAFSSDNYAKVRGGLVLRMLRKELGEAQWKKVLQHYVRSNSGKQVTTEDFQQSVKAITGDAMPWFFDQWIYKMGQPNFVVSKKYDAAKKQLILDVRQTQRLDLKDPYPQVEFFRGKVEIEIDNRIETVTITPKTENVYTFNCNQQPKLVNFDFEKNWIKEIQFEKTFEEWLYQSQNSKDLLARMTAMDELVKIAKSDEASAETKQQIITVLRNIAGGNDYWRFRTYALGQLRAVQPACDEATIATLLKLAKDNHAWMRTSALFTLGNTKDPKYADLYLEAFNDNSERVISAAANALGKSKSPKAFGALLGLKDKPSWKSQSLISTLNGLKELGDPRGVAVAYDALSRVDLPRWYLATPIWDYPVAAAETLVALGKGETAYPMLLERFKKSMVENDVNDIFANTYLLTIIADPRGLEVYESLKAKFKDDANAMQAVNNYEAQYNDAIKNKSNTNK